MLAAVLVALTVVLGYLIGSIPVAVVVGRRTAGVDLRERGDRNPGYWNARANLHRRAALAVFAGDVAKGAAAAGVGRALSPDLWWAGYASGAAAMVGHAWPVFAGFRGGRSILCFAGTVMVVAPVPAAVAIGACAVVAVAARRFAWGARVGVFGFPAVQALFDPRARVATTGLLMSIIGLRFAMAAWAERSAGRSPGRPPGPPGARAPQPGRATDGPAG